METLFLYLVKSCALLAVFFLAYHLLLRRETFFNANRWFLLAGLPVSVLMPLLFIKKVVMVQKPKISLDDLIVAAQNTATAPAAKVLPVETPPIDWFSIAQLAYLTVAAVLLVKLILNLISLFRLLHNQEIKRRKPFAFVDLNQEIAPFSFFKYIVFNSRMFTDTELESILNHEKVHSRQKHSLDVMAAKVYCALFWFNPFAWIYKKAIIQNLEYIADEKAIQETQDKKAYQIALLKVVTNQNCLSITNNFYQSLIKKRIVMLNKNQSKKRNLVKYAVIIPVLAAFMVYFQVKVVAQQRHEAAKTLKGQGEPVTVRIDKNSSDEQLKTEAKRLKDEHGIKLKISKVKRNNSGEITGIKVVYKDKDGNTGVSQVSGNEPIKPITFFKQDNRIGFGQPRGRDRDVRVLRFRNDADSTDEDHNFSFSFNDMEAPEAPEAPEMPEDIELPEAPEAPEAPEFAQAWGEGSKIIIRRSGEKPIVMINGKIVEGGADMPDDLDPGDMQTVEIISGEEGDNVARVYGRNGQRNAVVISSKDIQKITRDAMKKANVEIRKMKPKMDMARRQMELSKPEMEKATQEMRQAKEEMMQAKAEMEKARADQQKWMDEYKAKMKAEFAKQKAEQAKKPKPSK